MKDRKFLPLLLLVFFILGNSENIFASVSNIKICALRISFQEDDNDATTGNGKFLLSEDIGDTICQSFRIDPPPHDREYFKDHIKSAANYFSHVSKGNVLIDTLNSEVYPLTNNTSYELSHKMDYYHPFLKEDSIDIRLAELFEEAILLADEDVNFSRYDVVVIFHAGVGQDFAILLDPTPYDIPSAFLNSNDLNGGIAVDNSTFVVSEGIILPETQNHILYPNWDEVFPGASTPCEYQIGLNGTFAFMMGFYLRLPGLYDTETGETGIGKFGLMDQGSANLNGLIPAVPSAWERVFLGWEEPTVAMENQIVNLQHVESGSDTTIWKVLINSYEYFLVENRYANVRPEVSLDSIQYRIYLETGEKEWPSIFPLIRDTLGATFSENGVLMSVPRYDVGLPGSGLLIWHIDESVIFPNLPYNSVNVNRERRGVDLEEGDGAQDLGYVSQMFGANVDIGWFFDPWFAGNEGFWDLNPEYPEDDEKRVGFTNSTNPSSKSNDYAYTGISIDSIGPAGEVMNFRIKLEDGVRRLPISFPYVNSLPFPLFKYSDNGYYEIIFHADSIYILTEKDGNFSRPFDRYYDNPPNANIIPPIISSSDMIVSYTQNGEIVVLNIDDNYEIDLIKKWDLSEVQLTSNIIEKNNRIYAGSDNCLLNLSLDSDDSLFTEANSEIIRIAASNNNIFVSAKDGEIYQVQNKPFKIVEVENIKDEPIGDMAIGYLNNNEFDDIVICTEDKIHLLIDITTEEDTSFSYSLPKGYYPYPVLSDIDNDNQVELIVASEREIYAFTGQLILESSFPIPIPTQYSSRYFEPNILTSDINGDGNLEIITSISKIGIVAFDRFGNMLEDFPKCIPNHISFSNILINSQNGTEFITVGFTRENNCSLFRILISDLHISESGWLCYGGSPDRKYFYEAKSKPPDITSESLLDKDRTFNWPNPVKDNSTYIRFFPNKECEVSINIYDLAGDFIKKFENSSPMVGDYNEIEWDVSNIESGVYFAVVRAEKGSKTDSKIVKIMVIK